ncbi:MAG: ATP-dependent sacrificial sulfur transferase LarE [Deltaproteobacteria bacterium]
MIKALEDYIAKLGKVAVAYSGGVDSTFLLATSSRVLGGEQVVALTIQSPLTPPWELDFAHDFCRDKGIKNILLDGSFVLDDDDIVSNPPRRCYFCKKRILGVMQKKAPRDHILITGTNASDESDFRPGMRAEEEMGVKTPLRELRFTKDMIREFSKIEAIPGFGRPPAACFATRIPYGESVTLAKVRMVGKAETVLRRLGFELIRVRMLSGGTACIEVAKEEGKRILALREEISRKLGEIGFRTVTLDLEGYRQGKLNEGVD